MIRFPVFVGLIYTLPKDYKYVIAGEVIDIIKAGTQIYFEGRNIRTGMYLYSC